MAPSTQEILSTPYVEKGLGYAHPYILPCLFALCSDIGPDLRVLDVGCGNGAVTEEFAKLGCSVVGIDMSESGIRLARESCPAGRFELLPADSAVLENLGERPFDLVFSLEVIEHLYDPRAFLAGCFAATRSGGQFICSTPYHGYLKNLLIAALGGWDRHHNANCDGGHIQFFSRKTLSDLFRETGFRDLRFRGSGRVPYIWKSMLISGIKR